MITIFLCGTDLYEDTGIVTFESEACLDCHTHPCSESITVLEGQAEVTVEGHVYRLGPLSNITIPRWLPHAARNPDLARAARVHIALAMSPPQRQLVRDCFIRTEMPADSIGLPGLERVTRFGSAERSFGVGLGAEFIDYFNESATTMDMIWVYAGPLPERIVVDDLLATGEDR